MYVCSTEIKTGNITSFNGNLIYIKNIRVLGH